MSNPILLSETQEYLYYGIEIPRNASYVDRVRRNDGQYCLSYVTPLHPKWAEIKYIDIGDRQKIEILGILGKDCEVSEEVAKKIIEDRGQEFKFRYRDYMNGSIQVYTGIDYWLESEIDSLKSLIKSKGLLIENPIEKPKFPSVGVASCFHEDEAIKEHRKLKAEWQSFEDKLVKVVLIKVKK